MTQMIDWWSVKDKCNKMRWKTEKWNGMKWGERINVRSGADLYRVLTKVEQVNDNLFLKHL